MDAHKAIITNIFNNSTLVEVPFFQRAYVWKEDLWGRMIEDMEFIVKRTNPISLARSFLKKVADQILVKILPIAEPLLMDSNA